MHSLGQDTHAVSDTVGQVLMLAVTVVLFGGLSVMVMDVIEEGDEAPRADVRVLRSDDGMVLRHQGGDAIPLDGLRLMLKVDDVDTAVEGAELAGELGDTWDNGESICLTCRFPGKTVGGVRIVHGNILLSGDGGVAAVGGGATALDVRAVAVVYNGGDALPGETTTFTAHVANDGVAVTNVVVRFLVDGAVLGETTIAGMAEGATTTATSPPWTTTEGDHVVQIILDPGGALDETDEGDNAASAAFTVDATTADPGGPFKDLDGDARYDPDVDVLLSTAEHDQLRAGSFDAGAAGLVVPTSTGNIAAASIDLRAGGVLSIHVDMVGNVVLVAGGDLVFDATAATSAPNEAISVSAGGTAELSGASLFGRAATISAGGALRMNGTSASASSGDVALTAGDDIDLVGAGLSASRDLTAAAVSGADVRVDGASFSDRDNTLAVTPADVVVMGTPAQGGVAT